MSGKRVPRASLIRSNVRSLNFPSLSHTRSPSFSFVQSVTQSHYQLVSCSQIEHFSNSNNNNYTTFGLVTSIFPSQLHKLSCTFFAYIIQFFLLSLSHYAIKLVNVPQTQFRYQSPRPSPLLPPPTCHHSAQLLIVFSLSWGHFVAKLKLLLIKYNFCLLSSWPTFQE